MAVPAPSGALVLPSPRTAQPKQWDCFLCVATLSGSERRPVSSKEICRSTGLSVETVGGVASFLQSVGLVVGSRGTYAVTEDGLAVAEMSALDATQGRLQLQGMFLVQWPARIAYGILRDGPVSQDEFVEQIEGETAGHSRRGRLLVDWLVTALLVHRDAASTVSASSALLSSGHLWQDSLPAAQESHGDVLMGMVPTELRALQPHRYLAVMNHVASLSEMDLAD